MMCIKVIFHEQYYNFDYASDPAAAQGRLDRIMQRVETKPHRYEILSPEPASDADILRAHGRDHLEGIKTDPVLYEMSALAAGGAIMAARTAFEGSPSFAVIRPPGHHASADSCWGFCYVNNMAVSLLNLFAEKKIKSAFILDFDLHTGDGNLNILENRTDGFRVHILNPVSMERNAYLEEVEAYMDALPEVDIFAASAGFDQGIDDWGDLLFPEDYTELGRLMAVYSKARCQGKRYAILEGGYNHEALGLNTDAFCKGFV